MDRCRIIISLANDIHMREHGNREWGEEEGRDGWIRDVEVESAEGGCLKFKNFYATSAARFNISGTEKRAGFLFFLRDKLAFVT